MELNFSKNILKSFCFFQWGGGRGGGVGHNKYPLVGQLEVFAMGEWNVTMKNIWEKKEEFLRIKT